MSRAPGTDLRRRESTSFEWSASCGMAVYATLAGVRFDRLFLDADAIAEAYTKGRPMAEKLFGPEVSMGGPTWAGISYGHASCLGCELVFPPDSEVGRKPAYGSLDEALRELRREVDFSARGMFPFYLELWERLKRLFPSEKIQFHFPAEGPITTGWTLRGHDFFEELLTAPEKTFEFLQLATESIIKYNRFIQRVNGRPEIDPSAAFVADDISSMISPSRWPDLVLPLLHRYYKGLTTGERHAHIENLTPLHLKYLDELRLDRFDPSVSPKLTPQIIRDRCKAPFAWRLNSTHYPGRTPRDVERWVFEAAADGASEVFTIVWRDMCTPECAEKVEAFVRAARKVKALLDGGCGRGELLGAMDNR